MAGDPLFKTKTIMIWSQRRGEVVRPAEIALVARRLHSWQIEFKALASKALMVTPIVLKTAWPQMGVAVQVRKQDAQGEEGKLTKTGSEELEESVLVVRVLVMVADIKVAAKQMAVT